MVLAWLFADVSILLIGTCFKKWHLTGLIYCTQMKPKCCQVRRFVSATITICQQTVTMEYKSICSQTATNCISSLKLSITLFYINDTSWFLPVTLCSRSCKCLPFFATPTMCNLLGYLHFFTPMNKILWARFLLLKWFRWKLLPAVAEKALRGEAFISRGPGVQKGE